MIPIVDFTLLILVVIMISFLYGNIGNKSRLSPISRERLAKFFSFMRISVFSWLNNVFFPSFRGHLESMLLCLVSLVENFLKKLFSYISGCGSSINYPVSHLYTIFAKNIHSKKISGPTFLHNSASYFYFHSFDFDNSVVRVFPSRNYSSYPKFSQVF